MALNVLIVDDSEVMRRVIRRIMTLSGFEFGMILEAEHGEKALSVLDENWVDVVISDINSLIVRNAGCFFVIFVWKKKKHLLHNIKNRCLQVLQYNFHRFPLLMHC